MSVTRVAVIGAAGRMGSTVCGAVEDADGLELVGRFDAGDDLGDLAGADVAVEFSVPDASPANVATQRPSRARWDPNGPSSKLCPSSQHAPRWTPIPTSPSTWAAPSRCAA